MTVLLVILLVLAAGATAYMLFRGLQGLLLGNVTPQQSQNLMRKRVLFQAVAIIIAMLILLLASGR
ncbi:MAG: HIG1 domain-containing protein [Sphingomonas sp.]|nr:HIG1 domain-containing protein [Sphingomonas sp.]